jgi:hypothetical protein
MSRARSVTRILTCCRASSAHDAGIGVTGDGPENRCRMVCQWTSIRPGMSTRPPRSMPRLSPGPHYCPNRSPRSRYTMIDRCVLISNRLYRNNPGKPMDAPKLHRLAVAAALGLGGRANLPPYVPIPNPSSNVAVGWCVSLNFPDGPVDFGDRATFPYSAENLSPIDC